MRQLLSIILVMTFVQAEASESYSSYEDIVRDLTTGSSTKTRIQSADSDLEFIRIHGSVGAITSRLNLKLPDSLPGSTSLAGVEAVLGIDLFTPKWIAEGAVRSFNREAFSSSEISLKEFDLRLIHQIPMSTAFDVRFGGGMSARYLTFTRPFQGFDDVATEYTTPASVFIVGVQTKFNHAIGLTAELAYRARLISETVEKSAVDGSIRLSGSF